MYIYIYIYIYIYMISPGLLRRAPPRPAARGQVVRLRCPAEGLIM